MKLIDIKLKLMDIVYGFIKMENGIEIMGQLLYGQMVIKIGIKMENS